MFVRIKRIVTNIKYDSCLLLSYSFFVFFFPKNNKLQELGAALLRKASGSTNLHAGDGTTSTIIIAEAILK